MVFFSSCWWKRDSCPQGHSNGREHNIWHSTDAIKSNILVTSTHSPGEEDTGPYWATGLYLGRVNRQGLRDAEFLITKGEDGLWSLQENAIVLYEWSRQLSGNWHLLFRDGQALCLVPIIRRVVCLGELIMGNIMGRGTYPWDLQGPPGFPQMPRNT